MYCPNCGVQIHQEGSFCAKCRKDVAYLTKKPEEPVVPDENETLEESAESVPPSEDVVAPKKTPVTQPKKHGYYCNFCGTFVYPEDHYCYSCGKKTRPKYYKEENNPKKSKKSLYIGLGIVVLILLLVAGALLR